MWPNPPETPDLVTLTEETLKGKLLFLCSEFDGRSNLGCCKMVKFSYCLTFVWNFACNYFHKVIGRSTEWHCRELVRWIYDFKKTFLSLISYCDLFAIHIEFDSYYTKKKKNALKNALTEVMSTAYSTSSFTTKIHYFPEDNKPHVMIIF